MLLHTDTADMTQVVNILSADAVREQPHSFAQVIMSVVSENTAIIGRVSLHVNFGGARGEVYS